MKSSVLLLLAFVTFFFIKRDSLLDTSQNLFFPSQISSVLNDFNSFPVTSWNHLIPENNQDASKLCEDLKIKWAAYIKTAMCQSTPADFLPLINSFLDQQFTLFPAPDRQTLSDSADTELAKISLLMGPEAPTLISLIRPDPMNRKDFLLERLKGNLSSNFEMKNGFLTNKNNGQVVIPVQFHFPPSEIPKTAEFLSLIRTYRVSMLGPHEGYLSNRSAIEDDLQIVGLVGTGLLLLLGACLAWFRLFKLIKLMIPTALGICISFIVTWMVFGSVHGITLSFGTGIIGLAIDYGFHYIFSRDKKEASTSNLYALLTTLLVFVIFLFSSLPIIRQMMFFSTFGLVASYVLSRVLLRDEHMNVEKNITLKQSRWHIMGIAFVLFGVMELFILKVDTSLRRFNYTPKDLKTTQDWFYSQMAKSRVFFKVYSLNDTDLIRRETTASQGKFSRVESLYSYIPSEDEQKSNFDSWTKLANGKNLFTGDSVKVFSPFTEKLGELNSFSPVNLKNPPEFLSHLVKENKALTMWFVDTPEQESDLKNSLPGVESLYDIISRFTSMLSREISLFLPLSALGILLLLLVRYRSLKKAGLCLIPFLFSLGLISVVYRVLSVPLTFMSLLGLILIYGLSVDYGIFTTDFYSAKNRDVTQHSSLNLSLLVNWASGIVGFVPLVFCRHPILHDLGLVLTLGMVGIFYSTFYFMPALFSWRMKA